MMAGLGSMSRSLRTTSSLSDSTISALPSITRRNARRTGTMVSGSNEAFNARHRTLLLRGEDRGMDTQTQRRQPDQAAPSPENRKRGSRPRQGKSRATTFARALDHPNRYPADGLPGPEAGTMAL